MSRVKVIHCFIALVFVFNVHKGTCDAPDSKIMGGKKVHITETPHQIAVLRNDKFICGGSILRQDVVISAAHCTTGHEPSDFTIRAGMSRLSKDGQKVNVKEIIPHEHYHSVKYVNYYKTAINSWVNDVCLIILKYKLSLNGKVNIIPLPKLHTKIPPNTLASASGWGYTDDIKEELPDALMRVNINTITQELCKQHHEEYWAAEIITEQHICTYSEGKDACKGDSGGPLVIDGYLAGITSFGLPCDPSNIAQLPGVFTNISYFLPWIRMKLNKV